MEVTLLLMRVLLPHVPFFPLSLVVFGGRLRHLFTICDLVFYSLRLLISLL